MSNFYLPIYNRDSKSNISIYSLEYNSDTLKEFLEYIRVSYQDKHLVPNKFNSKSFYINTKYFDTTNCEINEYKINPAIYNIFLDIIKDKFLKLRPLGLYMQANFNQSIPNNYTENEKMSILLQLKKAENISKDIHVSDRDRISNDVYLMELQDLINGLTITEKDMLIKDFENIVAQFFDLFEIDEIKYKRHYSKNFDFETAILNQNILKHDALQKVYKRIF